MDIWDEILVALGTEASRLKRLGRVRRDVLDKVPKTRNDFKPETQLNKTIAGMGIHVLDSNKVEDRPKDWKERLKRFPTNQNNSDVNFSHNAANSNETNDPRNNETGNESSEKTH